MDTVRPFYFWCYFDKMIIGTLECSVMGNVGYYLLETVRSLW